MTQQIKGVYIFSTVVKISFIVACELISGYLADVFDCYTWPFFMVGILTHIAGLLPLLLFCVGKKKSFDLKKNVIREEPLASYRQHNSDINKCKLAKSHAK